MTFEEANKVAHPVEAQWHYKVLTPLGWVAQTKEAVGFVRGYAYTLPGTDLQISCNTGASADYWTEKTTKSGGYWGTLEKFAQKIQLDMQTGCTTSFSQFQSTH
jgi:hypothetical protein